MSAFAFATDLDLGAARARLAEAGRVRLAAAFDAETAEAVATALETETDWTLSVRAGDSGFEAPLGLDREPASETHRRWLEESPVNGASGNMQHLFDTRRISNMELKGAGKGDLLDAFGRWLNSEAFLAPVRELTGDERPTFCDVQATRYRPGHFLTVHNDMNGARDRLYAYVLNFTREWRTDWGGLLVFHDDDGHVGSGFTPAFNALNLFRVPQKHAVTYVAPFAPRDRLSITGWIRWTPPQSA